MSKYDMKSPAPGLYIPSIYAINKHTNEAVLNERQRVQTYFVDRHKLYMAQHIKLNDLAIELNTVEVIAACLTGKALDEALQGKTGRLTDKLDAWVRELRALVNPEEVNAYPDVVRWVSDHVRGIQLTDRNHPAYDGGDLLRQLGRKANDGYGTNTFINALAEIDRGGRPANVWRMVLAGEIAAMKANDKTLRYPQAAGMILKRLKASSDLSEEWICIRDEIQKRNSNRRSLTSWLSDIMADYSAAQLQMSEKLVFPTYKACFKLQNIR